MQAAVVVVSASMSNGWRKVATTLPSSQMQLDSKSSASGAFRAVPESQTTSGRCGRGPDAPDLAAPSQHRAPASWTRHREQRAARRFPARPRRPDPPPAPAWRDHHILHTRRGVSAMAGRRDSEGVAALIPFCRAPLKPWKMQLRQIDGQFLRFTGALTD